MSNVCNKCYGLATNHAKVVNHDELQDNPNAHWNEGIISDTTRNYIPDIGEQRSKSSSCISKPLNSIQQP